MDIWRQIHFPIMSNNCFHYNMPIHWIKSYCFHSMSAVLCDHNVMLTMGKHGSIMPCMNGYPLMTMFYFLMAASSMMSRSSYHLNCFPESGNKFSVDKWTAQSSDFNPIENIHIHSFFILKTVSSHKVIHW